jgi:hypothetical protein
MLWRPHGMKITSIYRLAVVLVVSTASLFAQSKNQAPTLLPDSFAGWTITGKATTQTDPNVVDPTQAGILKEFGFKDASQATYANGDNHVTVKAARFADASGAYGAFTFYRQPQMKNEDIGNMAVSDNEVVLFFKTNVLVQAKFDKITAMTGAAARELAAQLPIVGGSAATLPTLPNYVPRQDIVPNTAKYIMGQTGYASSGFVLPAQVVDFTRGAEAIAVKTHAESGTADLLLVSYPTPQIAMAKVKEFQAASPKDQNVTFAVKRTGPIVAAVSGAVSEKAARSILNDVNYEAEVTWNENTGLAKRDNIGNLVIAGMMLAGLIFVISVGTGAIFGFGRVFLRKILPERYAPKEQQSEFISLELKD